ncbi:hypothetical protein Aperf_G00000102028 [Anoplocephala perfoliata]
MANCKDDYGAYVFNNYARNCDLADAAIMAAPGKQAEADLMRRMNDTSASRNKFPQTMLYMPIPALETQLKNQYGSSSSPWATLRDEPKYLSLDSDSDGECSCNSSATCDCSCSNYTGSSSSHSKVSSSGSCSCDGHGRYQRKPPSMPQKSGSRSYRSRQSCSDRQSSTCSSVTSTSTYRTSSTLRSKSHDRCSICNKSRDNVREKKTSASSQHTRSRCNCSCSGRSSVSSSQGYHRCATPRSTMPSRSQGSNIGGEKLYRGVNPEIRPGPFGKRPEPDLLFYPP